MIKKKKTVLITTYPFAVLDPAPLRKLRQAGWRVIDPGRKAKRKATCREIERYILAADAVIAGTEQYDDALLRLAAGKLVSRVGIGVDNIDFAAAAEHGVEVAYTPDAPSRAVAELTVGQILACLRHVVPADRSIRRKTWRRLIGRELADCRVGIIGLGRIGKLVAQRLRPFGCQITANDSKPDEVFARRYGITWADKARLFRRCDVVTLHVPLTKLTRKLVNATRLKQMRAGSILINTARGGVVDEKALAAALRRGRPACAALDVFADEPYSGPLATLENVVLTAHMGSCTDTSRLAMEMGAVDNLLAWAAGKKTWGRVPDTERRA